MKKNRYKSVEGRTRAGNPEVGVVNRRRLNRACDFVSGLVLESLEDDPNRKRLPESNKESFDRFECKTFHVSPLD